VYLCIKILIFIQITIGVLFGTAAASVILRTVQRLALFHRLKLDDAFLWFALSCLGAATGIFLHNMFIIMIQEAIPMEPETIVPITEVSRLLSSISILDAFLCTIWTCTFAVKASFLALFWKLIQGISKSFNRYYWIVVGYTFVVWMFLIAEPFILCPHFGMDGGKYSVAVFNRPAFVAAMDKSAYYMSSKMLPTR